MNRKKTVKIPDLSVVVLCYRSGELARSFYHKLVADLAKHVSSYEIVMVGNYNSKEDSTPAVIEAIAKKDKRVVPVIKKKRGMMGWDMRSGLQQASGKYIAIIDGDDQFKPELVTKVYRKITHDQLDFVKTKRVRRDDGMYRFLISRTFNLAFKTLFGAVHFSDVNSKPKIMTRQVLDEIKLKDDGWFIDAEMMLQVARHQFSVGELDVRFHKNRHRQSFVGVNAILEIITKLLQYKMNEGVETFHALTDWRNWVYRPKAA